MAVAGSVAVSAAAAADPVQSVHLLSPTLNPNPQYPPTMTEPPKNIRLLKLFSGREPLFLEETAGGGVGGA